MFYIVVDAEKNLKNIGIDIGYADMVFGQKFNRFLLNNSCDGSDQAYELLINYNFIALMVYFNLCYHAYPK